MSDVVEIARVQIKDPGAIGVEEGMDRATLALSEARGCRGASAYRCIEHPETFVILVIWATIADHEAFRASEEFSAYRANIADFLVGPPEFAHYSLIAES
jgi:heme-degrading monooxygenase HmoA